MIRKFVWMREEAAGKAYNALDFFKRARDASYPVSKQCSIKRRVTKRCISV